VDDYLKLVQGDIPNAIVEISTHKARSSIPGDSRDFYDQVVSSRLSERLNDASLLLSKISEIQSQPRLAWVVDAYALQRAAEATHSLGLRAKDWEDYP
jgi:hypothetical protein